MLKGEWLDAAYDSLSSYVLSQGGCAVGNSTTLVERLLKPTTVEAPEMGSVLGLIDISRYPYSACHWPRAADVQPYDLIEGVISFDNLTPDLF